MKISSRLCPNHNFFRFCSNCFLHSSFSPKTLSPKSLNSVKRIFSLSGSSPARERQVLGASSSGYCSLLHFGLISVRIKLSCCSSSSGLFSNPFSLRGLPSRFSFETYSCCYLTHSSHNVCSQFGWIRCRKIVRCYSVSSSNTSSEFDDGSILGRELQRKNSLPKFVLEVVDMVRNGEDDMESRLKILHSRFNACLISEIFEVLSSQRISGLRLFEWIWSCNDPKLNRNARVCSLIIDNLGRLEDYENMYIWFRNFTSEKICLSCEAFGFLPVVATTDASLKESAERVLDLLKRVGGTCQSSGVSALIEMLSKLHLFEMAKHVIETSPRKSSFYRHLIREKCRIGHVEDAQDIIREMRRSHFAPDATVYNYVLGSLSKNRRMSEAPAILDEMRENGVPYDEITFEILINSACSLGDMDSVHRLLDQMVAQGLQPRPATHALIMKTLFAAERYEAAYKHAVDCSVMYKASSNMVYSLLAKLYREKGDVISAQRTLVDMMEKGLKPDFSVYIKVLKQLRRCGRGNLAGELERRHSKFNS